MTDFAEAIEQRVIPTSEHAPRLHDHEATILTVAARSFGVDVSAKDEDTWRVGAKASATIDTLVDEKGITDIRGIFDDVVSDCPMGVEGIMSDDEAEELAGFFNTLSPERQNAWREAAISLPDYADRKANAKTIDQLIFVTLEEAEKLFTEAFKLETEDRRDQSERERFNVWLLNFARAAYATDAALDMPRDYRREIIQVKPTLRNRAEMLLSARKDMVGGLNIGTIALLELGRTSWATVRERKR